MQRTKHGPNGASPLISVFGGQTGEARVTRVTKVVASLLAALAGCGRAPSDYSYLRPSRPIFFADFSAPVKDFWTGNDGAQEGQVEKGDYRFRSLGAEPRFNAPPFEMNAANDFEIEAAVAGPADAPDKTFGVVLGDFSGKESFLLFEVTRAGTYSITQEYVLADGQFAVTSEKTYRKLTIRKVGASAFFFVNERYVYSYPLPAITAFRAGVYTGQAGVVWADYFRVSQYN